MAYNEMSRHEMAETLFRMAEQLMKPEAEQRINLQGVADAMRDASLHAMHKTILCWLREFEREHCEGLPDDGHVERWFDRKLKEAEERAAGIEAAVLADISRARYFVNQEIEHRATIRPTD